MIACRMSPIWWREKERRNFYLFVYFVLTIKTIPKNHSNYILNIFKQLGLRVGAMKQIRVKKKLCV